MQTQSSEQLEAVFLFDGDQITREMLYSEFEAILDGFIPVPDYAGRLAKAVYLRINSRLCITAAVFFVLEFDAKGMIDRRWNVPLQQLAEAASRGPDLGAGTIRLACFSQCPIEWQRKNLWDPQMQPGCNSFVLMRKAVKGNRLGLIFKTAAADKAAAVEAEQRAQEQRREQKIQEKIQQKLHQQYSKELRDRLAHVIKEQRLRIATLENQQKLKIQGIQQEHQKRLHAYQQELLEVQKNRQELDERNRSLKEDLDVQLQKLDGVREYFSHKLKAAQMDENSQIQAMQENFALELEARLKTVSAELQEKLDMREVELFYRHEQEKNLRDEIAHLRRENQALLNNGSDQLLARLARAGINFVAFHPGAGNIAIPLDDMSRYLDNPQAYVAAKCGVTETLYAAWLAHYQTPRCTGVDHRGQSCNKPLARVATPSEFHEGEHDRCDQHQVLPHQLVAERR